MACTSKNNKITFVIISMLFFNQDLVNSLTVTQCNTWGHPAKIAIDCGQKGMIRVKDIQHGITKSLNTNFCTKPYTNTSHCFERYKQSEMQVALECNMRINCNETMPFLSFDEKCKGQGFTGDKYVTVTYDCLPTETNGREIMIYDMTQDFSNNIPKDWTSTEMFYLKSTSYPQFTSLPLNLCQIKLKENTKLKITIMDLYGKNDPSPQRNCPYQLLITNKTVYHTKCADQYFNINGIYEFQTNNNQDTVQIAFQEKHTAGIPQGKVWLEIKTYNLQNWLKAGISDMICDSSLTVWTTTTVQPSSTISTQRPINPGTTKTTSTMRPSISTYVTDTTMTTKNNDDSGSTTKGPEKLEDKSIMPIIAGVVAGGLVIIVIVIIIIVLCVRRHYVNNKPAKELDVIDAWDNQSVISAAQQSAKAYKAELEPADMTPNLPISYPKNSGPSFVQTTSVDGDIYAEVPSLPGSKAASEIGISNKGYEHDSYYTGDVDRNLYYNSYNKKNGHINPKETRVSQMYAQPMKKKTKPTPSGFDDPTWIGNGDVSPRYSESGQQDEVYGYTTTLDR